MHFTPHTPQELKSFNLKDGESYTIEYINKDYFNGEDTLEQTTATVIINNGEITFVVSDPYGMDKFITQVKVIL